MTVKDLARLGGCLVSSGRSWPSAADEWYSPKRPSSTLAVDSNELNTKVSAFSLVHFVLDRRNCLFLPPVALCVGLHGTASVCILRGTTWQLAPLQWVFPALRCSDNARII